ncbi:MAG: GNAT family N-acetyltransferase [Sediminibacterium sp.]
MEQIEYMLSRIYSEESLKDQMLKRKHQFLLASQHSKAVGFASYEPSYRKSRAIMLHKIYLLPQSQGIGIGKMIFARLENIASVHANDSISLKVFHKNEKAISVYLKNGFFPTA